MVFLVAKIQQTKFRYIRETLPKKNFECKTISSSFVDDIGCALKLIFHNTFLVLPQEESENRAVTIDLVVEPLL